MSGTVHNFPEQQPEQPAPSAAPPLPLEGQIASCAFCLSAARDRLAQLETLLRFNPRGFTSFGDVMRDLGQAVRAADAHYAAYVELLHCEGQA